MTVAGVPAVVSCSVDKIKMSEFDYLVKGNTGSNFEIIIMLLILPGVTEEALKVAPKMQCVEEV